MKKLKIIVIFLSFFLLGITTVNAEESNNEQGYTIDNYDISIRVSKDKVYNITETIDANFYEKRHGIFRNLTKYIKVNGKKVKAKISNIDVSEQYNLTNDSEHKTLQIGSISTEILGPHTYIIKYTYKLDNNLINIDDDFYFNIIEGNWKVPIKNVSFSIELPDKVAKNKIDFIGNSKDFLKAELNCDVIGSNIEGTLTSGLSPQQGFAIKVDTPKGYFILPKSDISILQIFAPIIMLIITLFVWAILSNSKEVIDTVEFYPPEDFNSLELALAYKGKVDNRDVISLLIYLASKGYLKITDSVEKKKFKITKLKDYDGDNEIERAFMDGIFSCKDSSIISLHINKYKEEKNKKDELLLEVASESLYHSFYRTIDKIKGSINHSKLKNKLFASTLNSDLMIIGLMFITYYITNYNIMGKETIYNIFNIIMTSIGFYLIISAFVKEGLWYHKLIKAICGLFILGLYWLNYILPYVLAYTNNYIIYLIGLICIIIMYILTKDQEKRTDYGVEVLGKILGFKHFLETAEKEQLEAMVEKDPDYFYNILPYTYVLDISNNWIKRFEDLALKVPDWYTYNNGSISNWENVMLFIIESSAVLDSRPIFNIISTNFLGNSIDDSNDSKPNSFGGFGGFGGGSLGGGSSSGNGGSW